MRVTGAALGGVQLPTGELTLVQNVQLYDEAFIGKAGDVMGYRLVIGGQTHPHLIPPTMVERLSK